MASIVGIQNPTIWKLKTGHYGGEISNGSNFEWFRANVDINNSKSGPFHNQTHFDHSKFRHVHFSVHFKDLIGTCYLP